MLAVNEKQLYKHVTCSFMESMPSAFYIVKLDFTNVYNKSAWLCNARGSFKLAHEIYKFCHLSYACYRPYNLDKGLRPRSSEECSQQSDPTGSLLFQRNNTVQSLLFF